ncbi:hypothetical protein Afe04nite_70000 [Asanoa ferruginea]|nr:hypothetical protein Afe04nite_70000 [Asanoa ferruginea]
MRRGPKAQAALVVLLGLAGGVVTNMATSGFDVGAWRWWLTGSVVAIGGVLAILEYRREQPTAAGGGEATVPSPLVDARQANVVQLAPHIN